MAFVDHYVILGLPSGEGGVKLSEQQIKKAFKLKALEIHPDKRPDVNPATANSDFQRLQESYQILIDAASRQLFNTELLTRLRATPKPRQVQKQHSRAKTRKRNEGGWSQKVGEATAERWRTYQEEGTRRSNSCYEDIMAQWWRKMKKEEEARWGRKTREEEKEVGRKRTKEAEEAKHQRDMEEKAKRMNLFKKVQDILANKRKAEAEDRVNQAKAAEELQRQELDRIRAKKARFEKVVYKDNN